MKCCEYDPSCLVISCLCEQDENAIAYDSFYNTNKQGSTMVDHSTPNPKIKGSIPPLAP